MIVKFYPYSEQDKYRYQSQATIQIFKNTPPLSTPNGMPHPLFVCIEFKKWAQLCLN